NSTVSSCVWNVSRSVGDDLVNWQAGRERVVDGLRAARAWAAPRVTRRRILLGFGALAALLMLSLSVEALIRGRLDDPFARMPSALYTRPVAWNGGEAEPVMIAPIGDAPSEWREPVPLAEIPVHL